MPSYFSDNDLQHIENRLTGRKHCRRAKQLLSDVCQENLKIFYVDELKVIVDYIKEKERISIVKGGRKNSLIDRILNVVSGSSPSPSIGPWPKFSSLGPGRSSSGHGSSSGDASGGGNVPNNNPLRHLNLQEEKVFEKLEQEMKNETLQSHDPFYKPRVLIDVFHIHNSNKTRSFEIGLTEEHRNLLESNDRIQCHLVLYNPDLSSGEWLNQMVIQWNGTRMVPKRAKRRKRNTSQRCPHFTTVPIVIGKHQMKRQNRLDVFIPAYAHCQGDMAIELVERHTTQDLVTKIRNQQERNALENENNNTTQQNYSSSLSTGLLNNNKNSKNKNSDNDNDNNDENEDLQIADHETVILNDPLSYERIEIPAKGHRCSHKACFDLYNFLELSHKQNKWVCPICNANVPFHSIIIDPLISKALSITHDDRVQIKQDGTVVPLSTSQKSDEPDSPDSQHTSASEQKNNLSTSQKDKTSSAPIVTIDDDDNDENNNNENNDEPDNFINKNTDFLNNNNNNNNNINNDSSGENEPNSMEIDDQPNSTNNLENIGQSWDDPICL